MSETDRLLDPRDLPRAVALLTRLPAPGADAARGGASAWAWPFVGLIVALLAGAVAIAALWLGLPASIASGLALASMLIVTGGLHADGLADCADGFWGGQTPERRLDILKDSRIGSYGVIALIVWLALHWTALTLLIDAGAVWLGLILPAMASRAAMACVMAALPHARPEGLARHVGHPPRGSVVLGLILAALPAALWLGPGALVLAAATAIAAVAVAMIARAKIGGQTGDVLGASQTMAELAAALTLVALLA